MNLNGLWEYGMVSGGDTQPESYSGKILVPYPLEAPLSGVGQMIDAVKGQSYATTRLWYRRSFLIPEAWAGNRILLHFGAVNWESKIALNGKFIGQHRGGYDGFSMDITDALKADHENVLEVSVWNPLDEGGFPRGKQTRQPSGIYYTPSTGIWQTVWLEPVPRVSIESLKIVPDVDHQRVQITCSIQGESTGMKIQSTAWDGQTQVAETTSPAGQTQILSIPKPKLWSPDSPFLYRLKVEIVSATNPSGDSVESYFGMRKVSLGKDKDGIVRILLNNQFVMGNGVLDQGFWPDGNYTAPTDEALQYDIESIKKLGFNLSRKHVKVEPDRWYYWADKLGLMVWQDMPCTGDGIHAKPPVYLDPSSIRQKQFGVELKSIISDRFNHPSIVMWIVFNEGMGLWNPKGYELDDDIRAFMRRMVDLASASDQTRVINGESGSPMGYYQGWNVLDIGTGQIMDAHCYGTTKCITPTEERASVIGEYGYAHYLDAGWKYQSLIHNPGISGLIWTQITDVENEKNGLMTYDRSQFTEDPEKVARKNAEFKKQY